MNAELIIKFRNLPKLLFGIVMLSLVGCHQAQQTNQNAVDKSIQTENAFQPKSMLLGGISEAVCYSGFRAGQHPDRGDGAKNPSYEETLEDLQILMKQTPFRLIRVYDSGENTELVLRAINENNLDIKVMLGIWLRAELSNHESCSWLTAPISQETLDKNREINAREIERGIRLANRYKEIVIAVNVGNEALVDWNDHKVATDTITGYVKDVKDAVSQQVTVADNYKWWADNGQQLARVVDFVSIHVYPVWEGKDIDEGMSYTLSNIEEVRKVLPEAPIIISEAGWPSVASEFGERANQEKQKQYCEALLAWSNQNNVTTFIFEAFDETWKGNPNNILGAEKHWGLFTVDRKPKKVMQ